MILVRNVFQLKFGKARDAVDLWKEGIALFRKHGIPGDHRVLTDLIGPNYYTLVFESAYASLTEFESAHKAGMAIDEWRAWYQKVVPLCESGRREIFNIVD